MSDIDYLALDENIREVVKFITDIGFVTTGSGDGKSKLATYGEGNFLPFPHVVMMSSPEMLMRNCQRLYKELSQYVDFNQENSHPQIQGMFDPADGTAVIILTNFDDTMLLRGIERCQNYGYPPYWE